MIQKDIDNLLIAVFDSGLDEDAHFRNLENLSLEDLEVGLQRYNSDTIEYRFLSRLIIDMKEKNKYDAINHELRYISKI